MSKGIFSTRYIFANPTEWEREEMRRVALLPDKDVISEIYNTMNGFNYSWITINRRLREVRGLEYGLYREWNFLCDRKREWEEKALFLRESPGHTFDPSAILLNMSRRDQWNSTYYRHLLVNLKILPVHAGLGDEGKRLVNCNLDGPKEFMIEDLWIDSEGWKLKFLEKQWDIENVDDEEAPLLGGLKRNKTTTKFGRWLF